MNAAQSDDILPALAQQIPDQPASPEGSTATLSLNHTGGVIVLAGELDLGAAVPLHRLLVAACGAPTRLVLDLAHVTFVDCLILGLIAGAERRCRAQGGYLVLTNARAGVTSMLRLTGLAGLAA